MRNTVQTHVAAGGADVRGGPSNATPGGRSYPLPYIEQVCFAQVACKKRQPMISYAHPESHGGDETVNPSDQIKVNRI